MKNNKGITLISLVLTIIVLAILASVAVSSGKGIINTSKLTAFTTEMKIMQTQVNNIYQKWQIGDTITIGETTYKGDEIVNNLGEAIDDNLQANLVFTIEESGITNKEGYKYFSKQLIKDLGIEGVEQEFFINIEKRSVVSYKGLNYEGEMYYTLDQLPNGLYNVETADNNYDVPTFDLSKSAISQSKWRITVNNIQYQGNIDKWQVQYKLNGSEKWTTIEDTSFVLQDEGIYNIKIKNGNVESDSQNIVVRGTETPVFAEEVATGGDNTWTRANGQIEIEFLQGTGYTVGQANAPKIDEQEMVPVNWNGTNWVVTDTTDWEYSYDDTNKQWANVMLRDTLVLEGMDNTAVQTATIANMKGKTVTTEGSMLVWLPRYAYRIIYFDTEPHEEAYRAGTLTEKDGIENGSIVGYSDARGIVDVDGATPEGMNSPVTSISVGNYYRPHPAFEDGSETGYTQGEWNTKLTGIWMGKFETTEKVNDKITVRPNAASYVSQTIGTFYTDARNLEIANSHMAKNSEWGAMAYLTESKYGRNGIAVTKNDTLINGIIITGEEDYKKNIDQSTTGNVYGIYDTVGGSYEYVAGYIADSSRNYGNSFASTNPELDGATNDKKTSTQYATAYEMAESNLRGDNYIANINKKFGDGIIETSTTGTGTTSWHSEDSNFVGVGSDYNYPFFGRGGLYKDSNAGSFCFIYYHGNIYGAGGFRLCASVQ